LPFKIENQVAVYWVPQSLSPLAVVYLEFEKERGKSLIGKKFKEQRVYCPR